MQRTPERTSWSWLVGLLAPVLLLAACATTSSDDEAGRITIGSTTEGDTTQDTGPAATTPEVAPADVNVNEICSPMASADLLARSRATFDELQNELPLMKALHTDTVLIWERFDIQADHVMLDGLPTIAIWTLDLADNCEEIVGAVARPDRIRIVEWAEEDFSRIGGQTPWRTMIEADLAVAGDEAGGVVWSSIGNALHEVTSVDLRSDQRELAERLVRDYEPLVRVTLGGFALDAAPNPQARANCKSVPEHTAPETIVVESIDWDGDRWSGILTVVIRNETDATVHLVPQRLAETTLPGSNDHESAYPGAVTTELRGSVDVAAGTSTTLRVPVSTSSCTNVELPPGEYDLVLRVAVHEESSHACR